MAGKDKVNKKTMITILRLVFVAIILWGAISITTSAATSSDFVVDPYHEYAYENMLEDANKLQEKYPELIRLKSIGNSVEGRDLALIEFGNGERKIFLNGATHAREYITTTYLMYMIDRYAYAYANVGIYDGYDLSKILNSITFCIYLW
ncbi:MAG: M14 family zinc carboxypeptidase [Clostridia bacterium]